MDLSYNSVNLRIMQTNIIHRMHEYTDDGMTYLYTRWMIDVYAVVNKAATSYAKDGAGVLSNTRNPKGDDASNNPVTIDKAIRSALRTPRKSLIMKLDHARDISLIIFDEKEPCDVKGGPFPRLYDAIRCNGNKTFIVHFAVETFVRESEMDGGPEDPIHRNPLISHRWTMTEDTNQDHFLARIVRGKAVFRLDYLMGNKKPQTPDQYRKELFHSIPPGWRRTNIKVTPSSDGSSLDYSFTDIYDPAKWGNLAITRLEIFHTTRRHQPYEAGVVVGKTIDAVASGLGKRWGATAGNLLSIPYRMLPSQDEMIVIKVWGDPDSHRKGLVAYAFQIATSIMAPIILKMKMEPERDFVLTRDRVGYYVQLEVTLSVEAANLLISDLPKIWDYEDLDADLVSKPYLRGDQKPGKREIAHINNDARFGRPLLSYQGTQIPDYPPSDGGTRGGPEGKVGGPTFTDSLISLFSQILENPGKSIPGPVTEFVSDNPDQRIGR